MAPKVLLFYNIVFTEKRRNSTENFTYDRGHLTNFDKIDVFKYTISSILSCYDFSKILIFCRFDGIYADRRDELFDYIRAIDSSNRIELYDYINEHQNDWKDIYTDYIKNESDLVMFMNNHDCVFTDYDTSVLEKGVNHMVAHHWGQASMILPSYPELLIYAFEHNRYDSYDDYVGFTLVNNCDSAQLLTPDLYRNWWFECDLDDRYVPMSDYTYLNDAGECISNTIGKLRNRMLSYYSFVPLREMFRHFDGYWHVRIDSNVCPAITIPPGFFEKNIKIRYGYDDYNTECVNVNPLAKNYRIVDNNEGVDYKWVIEDIPHFWKDRIVDIDINPSVNHAQMLRRRNQEVWKVATCGPSVNNPVLNFKKQIMDTAIR